MGMFWKKRGQAAAERVVAAEPLRMPKLEELEIAAKELAASHRSYTDASSALDCTRC